ncbi:MAG: hypothetical protein ACP5MT_01625 [Candidatus Acidifodinimicrobium sp.]
MDGEEDLSLDLVMEQLNAVFTNTYLLKSALEKINGKSLEEKVKTLSNHIARINSDLEKIRVFVR